MYIHHFNLYHTCTAFSNTKLQIKQRKTTWSSAI